MNKRVILLVLLAGIVAGVGIGLYMWNKPHRKAENEKGIPVTAEALFREFSANESAANTKYLNKLLEVTGTVSGEETNQDGQLALVLESGDPMFGVMCTMREKNIKVAAGSTVTIKGFCSGYVSDVKITDCILK